MKLFYLLRLFAKWLVIKAGVGPCLIEYCKDCGVRQWITWHADDELWDRVIDGTTNVVCPKCFDNRASAKGIFILWKPEAA